MDSPWPRRWLRRRLRGSVSDRVALRRLWSWSISDQESFRALRTAWSEGARRNAAQVAARETRRLAAQKRTKDKTAAVHLGPWSGRRSCCWSSCWVCCWTWAAVTVCWQGRMFPSGEMTEAKVILETEHAFVFPWQL